MILSETAKETAPYFPFEAINAVGKFGDAIKIYVQFVPIFFCMVFYGTRDSTHGFFSV